MPHAYVHALGVVHKAQELYDIVKVVKRLAYAHEHDMPDFEPGLLFGEHDLLEHFARLEAAHQPAYGRGAEGAALAAADLRGNAERISVCTLSPADTAAYSGETSTFSAIYQKYGLAGLRESVASALGISLERYVKQTETQLRQVIGEIGDISVNVPASIEYRGADYTLFLDAGEQSLTGDLFVKYIRYSAVEQQADAVCALVQNLLSAFDPADPSQLFNSVCNQSDTNFSVLDCTQSDGLLYTFLALQDTVSVGMPPKEGEEPA